MVLLQGSGFAEYFLVILSFVVTTVPLALGVLVFVRWARRRDDEVEALRERVEELEADE